MARCESRRWASGRTGAHPPSTRMLIAAIFLTTSLFLAFGIADGDVATIEDVQACNQEARVAGRTVSPTQKDEIGADNARNARAGTGERSDATGKVTVATDPQIDGIDSAGARDAAYRAAYRVCMRMKGF
jgi:hypothetical protein